MVLVERIEKLMRKLEIKSWRELARQAQISPSYLGDIKLKRTNPSLATLQAIAGVLRTSTGYLLGETDNPSMPNTTRENDGGDNVASLSQASQDLDVLIKELASKNPDLIVRLRNTSANVKEMSEEAKQTMADGLKYVLGLAELDDLPRLKRPKR